jgi:ABC-type transport system substrate-binding protein
VIQQSAAQAGFKLNLVKSPDIVAHGAKTRDRNWGPGLIIFARSVSFLDPSASVTSYIPGAANPGEVNDPEIVTIAQRLETTSGAERKAVATQLYENQKRNLWEVPFPYADTLTYTSSRFRNFRETAWFANAGLGLGSWDQVWLSS